MLPDDEEEDDDADFDELLLPLPPAAGDGVKFADSVVPLLLLLLALEAALLRGDARGDGVHGDGGGHAPCGELPKLAFAKCSQ